nr:CHAT domain-containing protein [Sphingomonas jatrophae]
MFDRAWTLVCRDAAAPVGRVYALRQGKEDPRARLAALRGETATCHSSAAASLDGLAEAEQAACRMSRGDVGYRVYTVARGRTLYAVEGLEAYDPALKLALRSIVEDRVVPGMIAVAATNAADAAAFARVQAGNLDLESALAEGYRRNNSGNYAESAEFFDTLLQRTGSEADRRRNGEYLINRALQKSNMGDFAEAESLFAQAEALPTSDPVQLRLRRNFKALHLVTRRRLAEAQAVLARPLAASATATALPDTIPEDAAAEINNGAPLARQLGVTENVALSPAEKAAILDAQARQVSGTVLRLQGRNTEAESAFDATLSQLSSVRQGRVVSIARLRAQTLAEKAAVREAAGDRAGAEALLRQAIALLDLEYPGSAALNGGKARLAAFLARTGQVPAALGLYREVVVGLATAGGTTGGTLLAPYFALLVRELPSNPALTADFFLAAETLVRPGVADTQAVLARELSGGSDEAARLFRQSVTLARDVERSRVELARLAALPALPREAQERMTALRAEIDALGQDQLATQAKLAAFPRYNVVAGTPLTLDELRAVLRPDEAYVKLAAVGDAVYGMLVTPGGATAWQAGIGATALDKAVSTLRDSIVKQQSGELLTFPFDVAAARKLYVDLFTPVEAQVGAAKHIVFEPDGAMLRLPLSLLIGEQAGVDAYAARQKAKGADEFDFRGVAWLGRRADISTAVSARGFRDVRRLPPSAARRDYIGFGQNAPVSAFARVNGLAPANAAPGAADCAWPLTQWERPIAATELQAASLMLGAGRSTVVTGAAFSDDAVKARPDLSDYRIVHFATHGLVTAPRPQCPARPALLTSFGGQGSDGLLSFAEIFDLRMDADLVILSACDTAGEATVSATRETGVTSGGGTALDGLVRAFVGAGGRSVLATHWPTPDDYKATERLIGALFQASEGTSVAQALQQGQVALMDQAETSHPFYWASFAVIGDGAQPVRRAQQVASAPQ